MRKMKETDANYYLAQIHHTLQIIAVCVLSYFSWGLTSFFEINKWYTPLIACVVVIYFEWDRPKYSSFISGYKN